MCGEGYYKTPECIAVPGTLFVFAGPEELVVKTKRVHALCAHREVLRSMSCDNTTVAKIEINWYTTKGEYPSAGAKEKKCTIDKVGIPTNAE